MDGTDYAWLKTSATFALYDNNISLGKLMPLNAFNVLPLKFFVKITAEPDMPTTSGMPPLILSTTNGCWAMGPDDLLLYNNFLLWGGIQLTAWMKGLVL